MAKTKRKSSKRKKNRRKAPAPVAATPKKKRARRRSRPKAAAPRKRARRRSGARRFSKWGKVKAHRRRTHNPSQIIAIGIAGAAGVGAYLAALAGSYYITKDTATAGRNRKIVGVAIAALGAVFVAKKKPLIGAAVAAAGLLAAFGDFLTMKLIQYLPQKASPSATTSGIAALLPAQTMNAVYADNMSAVYAENMAGYEQIGDIMPAAPWTQPGPFG
jgi:hypothetical protein